MNNTRLVQGNSLLATFQFDYQTYHHERRVKEASFPKAPSDHTHKYRALCIQNPKRRLQLQGKYTEVERENRILLEKISTITNNNRRVQDCRRTGSLNHVKRKKQVEQITIENNRIYNRIRNQKSNYCAFELEKEFRETRTRPKMLPIRFRTIALRHRCRSNK